MFGIRGHNQVGMVVGQFFRSLDPFRSEPDERSWTRKGLEVWNGVRGVINDYASYTKCEMIHNK